MFVVVSIIAAAKFFFRLSQGFTHFRWFINLAWCLHGNHKLWIIYFALICLLSLENLIKTIVFWTRNQLGYMYTLNKMVPFLAFENQIRKILFQKNSPLKKMNIQRFYFNETIVTIVLIVSFRCQYLHFVEGSANFPYELPVKQNTLLHRCLFITKTIYLKCYTSQSSVVMVLVLIYSD